MVPHFNRISVQELLNEDGTEPCTQVVDEQALVETIVEIAEGRETEPQQDDTVSESSVIILPSITKQLQTLSEVKDIIAAHFSRKQQLLAGIQFVQNGLRRKSVKPTSRRQ